MQVALRGETISLTGLGRKVQNNNAQRIGSRNRIHYLRHESMWQYRTKPRAWTDGDEIRALDGIERIRIRAGLFGHDAHAPHLARRGSDGNLAADLAHDTGVVVKPGYVRFNL